MASTTFSISDTVSQGSLSQRDQQKVGTVELSAQFDPTQDFAEASLYNNQGELVSTTIVNIGINSPSTPIDPAQENEDRDLTSNTVYIDPIPLLNPIPDFQKDGARAVYSFFRPLLSNLEPKEISYDRTEVKVGIIGSDRTQATIDLLITLVKDATYYGKIGIDHAEGEYTPIVNVIDDGEFLYLKLYRPLPDLVNLGDPININQEVADPVTVTYFYEPDVVAPEPLPSLRGANFNIDIDDRATVTTEYLDYNTLYNLPVTNSYNRVFSELEGLGVGLSVDYSDYSNFIHFSSAKERLANFKYKFDLYNQYREEKASAAALSNANSAITSSNLYYDNLIKGILTKFDGYERFLFYESSSKAWPKQSSEQPYINISSSLTEAEDWYAAQYATASLYDELNESNLEYTVPEFIRQDSNNAPYTLFLNMIGQHFDELWLYAKGITDRYNADNRLDVGISRDLIEKSLQGLGVKLYSSNFSTNNLTSLFLGEWFDTGSEQITSFVTASNDPTPDKDILAETYKRIYHNLPYLIKTKGTERGLRALINCFGIPSGSLSIETFGGVLRDEDSYFGYEYDGGSKIRLDNTGSILPGNTLSKYTSIINPADIYNYDLHVIEVGFSPTTWMDKYIIDQLPGAYMSPLDYANPYLAQEAYVVEGSFNIDNYIGDPKYLISSSYNNPDGYNLRSKATEVLSDSGSYDVNDFIRLTKFFDNQLFKMIKDFVPARDTVSAGVIIKPNILNRSKVQSPNLIFSQHEYTSSIDTAFITGSAAGIIDQHSTAYTASIITPSGSINRIYDDEAAQITGELSGTTIDIYSGSLNQANELKKPSTILPAYEASGSNSQAPSAGQFIWRSGNAGTDPFSTAVGVARMYLNEVDSNGINFENALLNLKAGDKFTFSVNYRRYVQLPVPGPTGPILTKTVTQVIEDIYSISSGVWYISFTQASREALVDSENTTVQIRTKSDSSVIFKPFINVENIDYHPYNATLNNATAISNASFLQEVDYSAGTIVPTNITQIRSNTAVKAEVNEYIHNSAGMVSGKYTGKQLNAAKLSVYTDGDKSYGKSPVIYYNDKYFGYAPDLERTDPVLSGKTQYSLRYLVDDNAEVIDLTNISNESQYVQQNFRQGGLVNVRLQNPRITELGKNPNYYLTGENRIHRSGERIELILTSESDYGVLMDTLRFQGSDSGIVDNYSLTVLPNFSSEVTLTDTLTKVDFKAASRDGTGYWNASQDEYVFGANSNAKVSFKFEGVFENTGNLKKREFQARIVRERSGALTEIASKVHELGVNDIDKITLQSTPEYFESGDKVYVQVKNINYTGDRVKLRTSGYPNSYINPFGVRINIGSQVYTKLTTTQTPQAQEPLNTAGLFSNGNPRVLTGSNSLNDYYGEHIQQHQSASVYPTQSIVFTVEPGDEFRFSNGISGSAALNPVTAEAEVYTVTDVEFSDRLHITLDRDIPTEVDIDGFVLRRYVQDPTSIILNQTKTEGDTSPAFVLPQHPPVELENNLSNIIKDLVGQNLI